MVDFTHLTDGHTGRIAKITCATEKRYEEATWVVVAVTKAFFYLEARIDDPHAEGDVPFAACCYKAIGKGSTDDGRMISVLSIT